MRIYIDTDELRSLARGLRADAGALGDVNTELIRGWAHTPPPPLDLIGVGARSSGVQAQVGVLGARVVVDATLLDVEATVRDAAEGAGGIAGQLIGTGPWSLMPGGLAWRVTKSTVDFYDGIGVGLKTLTKGLDPTVESVKGINRFSKRLGLVGTGMQAVESGVEQHRDNQSRGISGEYARNRVGAAIAFETGGAFVGGKVGAKVGAVGGAKLGALIGSLPVFAPPAGTVAGAAIGGVVGAAAGYLAGSELGKRGGSFLKEKAFGRFKGLFGG